MTVEEVAQVQTALGEVDHKEQAAGYPQDVEHKHADLSRYSCSLIELRASYSWPAQRGQLYACAGSQKNP